MEDKVALAPFERTSHGPSGSREGQHVSEIFNGSSKLRFPDHALTAVSFFLLRLEIASWFYSDHNWCQDCTAIVWLYQLYYSAIVYLY